MSALIFVVQTLFDLYVWTFVLRMAIQWSRADVANPLSLFVIRVTNPLVTPLRRVIPNWRGRELAPLLPMFVIELMATSIVASIALNTLPDIGTLLYVSLIRIIVAVLRLYFFIVLIRVIVSWISPGVYNPITSVLVSLSEPLLRPVRRIIPPIAGLDLSPLVVIVLLQAALISLAS